MKDITQDEAQQIVWDGLGAHFKVAILGRAHFVYAGSKVVGVGNNFRLALEAAGIDLRGPDDGDSREFVAIGKKVMRADEFVGVARSATMARRISNALNQYEPDERGR